MAFVAGSILGRMGGVAGEAGKAQRDPAQHDTLGGRGQ